MELSGETFLGQEPLNSWKHVTIKGLLDGVIGFKWKAMTFYRTNLTLTLDEYSSVLNKRVRASGITWLIRTGKGTGYKSIGSRCGSSAQSIIGESTGQTGRPVASFKTIRLQRKGIKNGQRMDGLCGRLFFTCGGTLRFAWIEFVHIDSPFTF